MNNDMYIILLLVLIIIVIFILNKNKQNIIKDSNIDIDNIDELFDDLEPLNSIKKTNIYDDIENLINENLKKTFIDHIDLSIPQNTNNERVISNTSIQKKLSDVSNTKTLWETFDNLTHDKYKKTTSKLDNNYSFSRDPVYELGSQKGSLYFDTY